MIKMVDLKINANGLIKYLEKLSDESTDEEITELIQNFMKKDSEFMQKNIEKVKNKVNEIIKENDETLEPFKERFKERWGEALDLLETFRILSYELGDKINKNKKPEEKYLPLVLIRLHARACLISNEIFTLSFKIIRNKSNYN